MFRAEAKRFEREQNERISLAWHTAALMRMKKLPPLSKLTKGRRARGAQTQEQQMMIAKLICAMHGGTVIGKPQ